MSQYRADLPNGNQVRYGLDLPTGGYFFLELREPENTEEDELVVQKDGLLLSQLAGEIKDRYPFDLDIEQLKRDWQESEWPTSLQVSIRQMFGEDLSQPLRELEQEMSLVYEVHRF